MRGASLATWFWGGLVLRKSHLMSLQYLATCNLLLLYKDGIAKTTWCTLSKILPNWLQPQGSCSPRFAVFFSLHVRIYKDQPGKCFFFIFFFKLVWDQLTGALAATTVSGLAVFFPFPPGESKSYSRCRVASVSHAIKTKSRVISGCHLVTPSPATPI